MGKFAVVYSTKLVDILVAYIPWLGYVTALIYALYGVPSLLREAEISMLVSINTLIILQSPYGLP